MAWRPARYWPLMETRWQMPMNPWPGMSPSARLSTKLLLALFPPGCGRLSPSPVSEPPDAQRLPAAEGIWRASDVTSEIFGEIGQFSVTSVTSASAVTQSRELPSEVRQIQMYRCPVGRCGWLITFISQPLCLPNFVAARLRPRLLPAPQFHPAW